MIHVSYQFIMFLAPNSPSNTCSVIMVRISVGILAVSTLSFLSRGCWRNTAGRGPSPGAAARWVSGVGLMVLTPLGGSRTQGPSGTLKLWSGLVITSQQPADMDTCSSLLSAPPLPKQMHTPGHSWLLPALPVASNCKPAPSRDTRETLPCCGLQLALLQGALKPGLPS